MMFDFSKYTNNGGQPSLGNMQQQRQQYNPPQQQQQRPFQGLGGIVGMEGQTQRPMNTPTQYPMMRNRQMRRPNPQYGRLNRPNGRDMYRQRLQQFLMNRPMRRNTMMSRGGLQGMGYRY